jgi:hypothetical protein
LKETKEENEDLKKRLDFMEKQQDILFSIVTENKKNVRHQSYPPPQTIKVQQQMSYQIDPFLRNSSESKVGSLISSAFKPSNASPKLEQPVTSIITPTPIHAQSNSAGSILSNQMNSGANQAQLLSELCASLMSRQS